MSADLDQCEPELGLVKMRNEELEAANEKLREELKRVREIGESSSETQNARILELSNIVRQLEAETKSMKQYKDKSIDLEQKCKDLEQSLEEIGAKLRESRLETENIRENSAVFTESHWVDSKQVKECAYCKQTFSVTRRKHHCRLCGNVFCQTCSDNKMELASSAKPARVCDVCHSFLLAKFVKSSSMSSWLSVSSSSTSTTASQSISSPTNRQIK